MNIIGIPVTHGNICLMIKSYLASVLLAHDTISAIRISPFVDLPVELIF